MNPIARFSLVALDCPDPRALAEFYGAITGWTIDPRSGDTWTQLRSDGGATLAFQHAPEHVRPDWPDGTAQQAHLDFDVPDLDAAERQILAIGATKAETQPQPEDWRVYLDPAGHPFCLVLEAEGTSEGPA